MEDGRDELRRTYARLRALRDNLPQHLLIPEKYVNEYHGLAARIRDATGVDLEEFLVPGGELYAPDDPSVLLIDGAAPGDGRFCDHGILAARLEALLMYFELRESDAEVEFALSRIVARAEGIVRRARDAEPAG